MASAKVLIVDDEKDFSSALADRMEVRGLTVDTAENGSEGIEKAKKKKYDAIILDLAMPGMDGIETMKLLLAENPDAQVIVLTGRATVQKGVEAVKAGAAEFIEKPADINTLIEHIIKARDTGAKLFEKRIEDSISDITKKKGW